MRKECRKCGKLYTPTKYQFIKGDYICLDCRRDYDAAWRKRRRAAGLRACGSKTWNPKLMAKWRKSYYSRPDVRKRRNEDARRYRNDSRLRMRHEARWQVRRAIRSGRLKRQPCQKCGGLKVEGHHTDYYKPLEVVWLCPSCHRAEHKRLAEGTQP